MTGFWGGAGGAGVPVAGSEPGRTRSATAGSIARPAARSAPATVVMLARVKVVSGAMPAPSARSAVSVAAGSMGGGGPSADQSPVIGGGDGEAVTPATGVVVGLGLG